MVDLINIMKLLPDNWTAVLDQAEEMGRQRAMYLNKSITLIDDNKDWLDTWIEKHLTDVTVDTSLVQDHPLFKKFEHVVIDFPALFSVPEGFDADNMTELGSLVDEKIAYLRTQLAEFEPETIDIDAVIAELKVIITAIMDIPQDLDFTNSAMVAQLKNEKLNQLRPSIYRLLNSLLNIDLTGTLADTSLDKLSAISDALLSDEKAPSEASNSKFPIIGSIREKLPVIEQELTDLNIPEVDIAQTSEAGQEVLTLLEERLPLIEQQFNEGNWEDFEPTTWVTQGRAILEQVKAILSHPSLVGILQVIQGQFNMVRLVDIDVTDALARLKEVFDFPEELSWDDPMSVAPLIKNKISVFLDLIACVEIVGVNTTHAIEKIRVFVETLNEATEEENMELSGGFSAALSKQLVTAMQEIMPLSGESNGWFEQLQKLQLIWQFISSKGLKVVIQDKIIEHQRPIGHDIRRMMVPDPQTGVMSMQS